ncbi:PREDICTED: putative sodium-dependent multivitamin transporter [Wasmannia auropunctata]|uniref:putative sodium-dependent multivitamin transporter n=1 Tax=Wasmannia auropunctata TaxID=64793 RepID=UPI0005EED116|nr:PREDICTED: putative sodium-dependent multivitamin transporter [Wasmannia auropunctata]
MTEIITLGWIDYLVIAVTLCISAGIGIYYRFSGGRQKTIQEYFIANRSMSSVPVAIAIVASTVSASGLLGISSETYTYGMLYVVTNLSYLLGTLIVCYGFLPVFYNLQTTTIYEYLERRFGVRARMMISFIFWIQLLLYSGVVLYAPSLVLETTTGISKIFSIIIIGLVCAFYSSIGGIKAVLTTDVFQILLMFAAVFLIIGSAANDVGGLERIWEIARQGQRLEFDSIDLDPTVKHTWWSIILGGFCTFLIRFGVNQVQIQRMVTVKNMQSSQRAIWLSLLILIIIVTASCFLGLAMYSRYHNCDPLLQKRITSPDMLMPLYVVDTMSNISGLPGLFVAGIFSASLSTISSIINSLAAVMLEDFLKPLYRKYIGHEFSPTKSAFIAKVLAFTVGIFSIVLAFLAQFFGGLFQAFYIIMGITGGPLLGIFTLGMGTESTTETVLTTDVFQILLMFAAVFLIIGSAANDVGGLERIWEIARQGQRLEFDSIDLDPTVKHTWWSIILGGFCTFLILFGVNQVQIQRMLTVKNMLSSQRALWLSWPIQTLLMTAICFSGLAMYSRYHNCDPLLQKRITSPDMLMPLYVVDTMSNIPGIPGLFVAGIFSASVSTISSMINSLAAVMLEDFLKPLYRKYIGHEFSSTKSAFIAKVLAFTVGIFSIILAFLAQFFGGLFQAFYIIMGITGGPLLGIFTLGMGTESTTESGAIISFFVAFSFLVWVAFGQPRPTSPKLPTIIDGCDNNVTNMTMSVLQNVTNFSKSTGDSSYFYLYRISSLWYPPIGFLITFLLGMLVSNLSGLFIKNQNNELDINLFFPVIARRICSRRRNDIAIEKSSSLDRRYSVSDVIHEKDNAADKIDTKLSI